MTKELYKLTPYIEVVETNHGIMSKCRVCGHIYGSADESYKYNSLIYERNPEEIHPAERRMAPDTTWCMYREYYCPNCGTQIEVEVAPHGSPIVVNYRGLA